MHFVAFHKFFILLVGMVPITLDISLHILLKVPRLIFIKNQKEEGEFLANTFPSPVGIQCPFTTNFQGANEAAVQILPEKERAKLFANIC